MLSKSQLVDKLAIEGVLDAVGIVMDNLADKHGIQVTEANIERIAKNVTKVVLDDLALTAVEEVAKGEDFVIPGIVRIGWKFRKPSKKGERWKKGEERVKFGGVIETAEADSPVVKAQVRIGATPNPAIKNLVPATKDADAQADFIKTKVGKAVAARKG